MSTGFRRCGGVFGVIRVRVICFTLPIDLRTGSCRNVTERVPDNIAIVVLGPAGAALGRRLQVALPGSRLHGPSAHPGDWDESYARASAHIADLFAAGRPILGLCASGILIRSVAPLLAAKRVEPPVVAVAEDGSVAVPLVGGHHGANALARAAAAVTDGIAAITTAGHQRLGLARDEPPPGWRIADPEKVRPITAALLRGDPVALVAEAGGADWVRAGTIGWAEQAERRVLVTDRHVDPASDDLVFHPPVLALGIGCERGCSLAEIADLTHSAMADAELAAAAVAAVVSVELKLAEPAVHALAAFRATGCWGVAEGAALAAAGPGGVLVVPKRKSRRATCAVARAPAPIDADAIGRQRGMLAVIGIGPGDPGWRTPEVSAALAHATDIVGYSLYLDLLGRAIAGKKCHTSSIGEEEARVRLALDLGAEGRSVALVSSGDPGIYGLAALVFELLDLVAKPEWGTVEIRVCPGVSALQAAAARAGAPLGHDFCAISLSDLMTPWDVIRTRLESAAAANFVVALYNPRSARRPARLAEAAEILLRHRSPQTPVFLGRNLGRPGEQGRNLALSELADAEVDMLTLVLVGSSTTRRLDTDPPRLYTPRGYLEDRE